jgi:hypothetical protein
MVEYEIEDCEIATTKNKVYEFVALVAHECGLDLNISEKEISEICEDNWHDFKW